MKASPRPGVPGVFFRRNNENGLRKHPGRCAVEVVHPLVAAVHHGGFYSVIFNQGARRSPFVGQPGDGFRLVLPDGENIHPAEGFTEAGEFPPAFPVSG